MEIVYLLYREVSDKYGTDKPVGAYSTAETANYASRLVRKHRTFVKAFIVDAMPADDDR